MGEYDLSAALAAALSDDEADFVVAQASEQARGELGAVSTGVEADEDEWLDTRACADEMGVSMTTFYRILKEDRVPVFRMSRRMKIRRSQLDALIDRHFGPIE